MATTSTNRPVGLTAFQRYTLERFDDLSKQMSDVRADVGSLKGRARAWGAVPGIAAVLIAVAAYFK